MNKFRKALKWALDNWKSISAAVAALLTALAVLLGVSSCGSMVKATIRTPKNDTHNSITISTNNPVEISPDTSPTITINTKEHGSNKK